MSGIYRSVASDDLCGLLTDSSVVLLYFSRAGKVKRKSVCPQTPGALITLSVLISPFHRSTLACAGGHSAANIDFKPRTRVP